MTRFQIPGQLGASAQVDPAWWVGSLRRSFRFTRCACSRGSTLLRSLTHQAKTVPRRTPANRGQTW